MSESPEAARGSKGAMRWLRLLFWSLVSGSLGAALFTGMGQLYRCIGGRCDGACRPSVTIPYGFLGGLLVIVFLERDRRARERNLEP